MLKSILLAAALTGMLAAPAFAKTQIMQPSDQGQIEFTMPSGNIGCTYTPEGGTDVYEPVNGGPELSCDRVEPSYVNVMLGPVGKAKKHINPGEQACCGGDNIFKYGRSVELDGFICYSAVTGLSCETEDGTHGFSMSRAKISVY